jgi:5-(carboxyamino)imidazole ribonucleotide synthase
MIGLMGGGQLGRMMIQAAHAMGERVAVLDPDPSGPASQLADERIVADYTDFDGLSRLSRWARVFTTEFENVPAESLRFLARHGPTYPDAHAVAIAQNRVDEKRFISAAGVDVAPHAVITRIDDMDDLPDNLFPGLLKTARLGYDGKGQRKVHDAAQVRQAWTDMGAVACVLEKMLPLEREISVICARDRDGRIALFPVGENTHRHGILAVTEAPARIPEALARRAGEAACRIADALSYVGVLCVEFFVLSGDRLLANEMAPRPHNSGHHTIESCRTSQFEQQVRICTGQPLGSTEQISPAVMLNVLGDSWFRASPQPVEPDWEAVRALRSVHLHLYGKSQPRPGRKMAHVTCLGDTPVEARRRAELVADILGLDVGRGLAAGG